MEYWIVLALFSAVFAALVAIFGKVGVQNVDSTLATAVRAIIMASFLVLVAIFTRKTQLLPSLNGKALLFISMSGIAGALSWLMYFLALKTGPASGVAALDRLSVVMVLIFAVIFLSEQLTWKTGIGSALITVGAILMSLR